jgi:beta-galactosidase
LGIPVDVVAEEADFSSYKLVIAPMMYMLKPGVAGRLQTFVEDGGTLVATYWTGIVDENDLCFLGGWPGEGLRSLFGVWDEETDTLTKEERNTVVMSSGNELRLSGIYEACDYFALIHAEGAQVLATFESDFYSGRPALTVNNFGKGTAVPPLMKTDLATPDLVGRQAEPEAQSDVDLPTGVTVQMRRTVKRIFFAAN